MDEVGNFLEEPKTNIAQDSALMKSDPPYMEIKRRADDTKDDVVVSDSASTQRKAPNPSREDSLGLSLLLGTEYEKKKQRLQQELRLDYRRYVAQKTIGNAGEPSPQPQNLSLTIDERRSAKEKLRDERNKEYNLFLKERAELGCLKKQASPATSLAQPRIQPPHKELLPSRKDAATLTEAWRAGAGTGAWGQTEDRRGRRRLEPRRLKEPLEHQKRRPRGRRVEYSSEEELDTEEEEEEGQLEFISRRRRDKHSREPEYTGRGERKNKRHPADRAVWETGEVEPPAVHKEDNKDWIRNLQMPDTMRTTERSRFAVNREKAQFATGLMIGAAEGKVASQMRKDRYRQELQDQIAEQQRNKKKEKELYLRVAATGAIDPEKKPNRIKQFGAVNRENEGWRRDVPYRPGIGVDALGINPSLRAREDKPSVGTEQRGLPEKHHVAFPSPWLDHSTALSQLTGRGVAGLGMGAGAGVPGVSSFNEDFHRSLSNTLGEIAAPRLAGRPPPPPPTPADTYKTPYDEAYYYYGARNPLDPNLPYYGPMGGGGQQPIVFPSLPQGAPPTGPNAHPRATSQHRASPLATGVLPGEKPKQTRESALSYQEALRQQIKEREERRRREREERERYDAKMEAEMKAYDPWGRCGGGAPIKDRGGKLISDLNQMHRTNEEAYINPRSRDRREAGDSVATNAPVPQVFSLAKMSPFARSNVFPGQPTPEKLREQDSYKDCLKQQIEEKRHKEVEERERKRLEEEREEKRLAEQRACMQQEYEEEQEKNKKRNIEQNATNKEMIRQAEERCRELEERRLREEEKRQSEICRWQREKEEQERLAQRQPSPLIPTLQRKLGHQQTSRPPTALSQFSSRTVSSQEHSMSAPHSPPVPAKRNQLRAREDKQGVIRELSALRRHLGGEERRLAGQLGQTHKDETDTPPSSRRRPRPKVDVFDTARMAAAQPSPRRPHSGAPHVNMQNIRDFNQLKYRDTASREEVCHVYPDPPSDEQSLDIQQQALLREQQRRIRSMRREEKDHFDQQQSHRRPRGNPAYHCQGDSFLASESAFIDCRDGARSPELAGKQRSPPPPAQDRERRRPPRRREYQDEAVQEAGQREYEPRQPDAQSLESLTSVNIERVTVRNHQRIRRLDHLDDDFDYRSGGQSGDEEDSLSLRSSPYAPERRVSVETVATEPWLRPGTSEVVKRQSRRERPCIKDTLDPEWAGPSTYHG